MKIHKSSPENAVDEDDEADDGFDLRH